MPELPCSVGAGLPKVCYAFIGNKAPGQRIVVVRAGVRGYAHADLDDESMTHAMAYVLVDKVNVGLGVTDAQQQAMLAGAVYGFHVPLANPAHPYHSGRYSKRIQSSMLQF